MIPLVNGARVRLADVPVLPLPEFTDRERWIGGFRRDGEPFYTIDGLKERLAPQFTLVAAPFDIPFVLRETRRKFQHSFAEMTIWERNRA